MEHWRKEFDKQESFEFGTPVVYRKNGQREVSGEVVLNRESYKDRNGSMKKPGTVKGISLYSNEDYCGPHKIFIVPDTWFDVRTFTEANNDYKKVHTSKKALNSHINKIKARDGRYHVYGLTINYFFPK